MGTSGFSKEAAFAMKGDYMKRIVLFRKSQNRLEVALLDAKGFLERQV